VIWSLLSGIHTYDSADELWRAKIGRSIKTGFLLSSAPRLTDLAGFSWAPATPYIRRDSSDVPIQNLLGPYLSYEGSGSREALITAKGLQGVWLVYCVQEDDAVIYEDAPVTMISFEDGKRIEKVLGGHRIINRCWKTAIKLLKDHRYVALIQPLSTEVANSSYQASIGRGESHDEIFAICVSDDEYRWKWKTVLNWPQTIPLPKMEIDDLLII
jgi:hypothetical protein